MSAAVAVLAVAVLLLTVAVVGGPDEVAPHGTPDPGVTSPASPTSPTSPASPTAGTEPKVFDADALATTIGQQYKEKFGDSAVRVSCPIDEPVVRGRVFYCSIDGRTERIEVTVRTEDGDYTWRPTGS